MLKLSESFRLTEEERVFLLLTLIFVQLQELPVELKSWPPAFLTIL